MLESMRWAAPVLGLISLAMAARAYYAPRAHGGGTNPSVIPSILIGLAILFGTVPLAFDVQNATIRGVTILVSMALSISAIVMLIRRRSPRAKGP